MLLFVFLFCTGTLVILLLFNPHHDPARNQYAILISALIVCLMLAYGLNCAGHYHTSAILFVACAVITPWASLLFDPSILQGDFVPLTYLTFSVLLSSILLSTFITLVLAVVQFTGIALFLALSPATVSFNWFSFLAFIFLTSAFGIIANSIIQRNMARLDEQARQLALNERHLQELSTRDYLTGLFNRRYLEETLQREIQRASRGQVPLGVVILDVDEFKHINDSHGHAAGDTVLRGLGKLLAGHIRGSDVACRYGGDEFVLILPDTPRMTVLERAEQLRDEARNLDHLPVSITISMGGAVYPDHGAVAEAVLKVADSALYQAKRGGGDRVMMAQ